MRERIAQRKKTTSSVSIQTLKQPTRGFGLESLNASSPAVTEVQPMNKPLGHDISRIALHRPQAKLTIGQPGDVYEQQADSVAQQVMQRIAQSGNRQSIQRQQMSEEDELQMKPLEISALQRQEVTEEDELQMKPLEISTLQRQEVTEEDELQMKQSVQPQGRGAIAASSDLETSINQARGGGQPLGKNIKESMEQAFGADFSGVKVHTDSQSDLLNQSIQARAFTTGQDIFFRQGEYNPGSRGGQELLAHELTHVVQQNGGTVMRSQQTGISSSQTLDLSIEPKLTTGKLGNSSEQEVAQVTTQAVHQNPKLGLLDTKPEATTIQRQYEILGDAARLPKDMNAFKTDSKQLHIFAHSSGEDLHSVDAVGNKDATAFAKHLIAKHQLYNTGEFYKQSFYSAIYIHGCNTDKFAKQVKDELVKINELNESATVYGTKGVSATAPNGSELWVIPMEETKAWFKFEEKLENATAKQDTINEWRKKVWIYPNGYAAH